MKGDVYLVKGFTWISVGFSYGSWMWAVCGFQYGLYPIEKYDMVFASGVVLPDVEFVAITSLTHDIKKKYKKDSIKIGKMNMKYYTFLDVTCFGGYRRNSTAERREFTERVRGELTLW